MQIARISEFLHVGLVETLSELSPHGIQHEFGLSASAWILANAGHVQSNAFTLFLVVDVLLALSVGAAIVGKTTRLLDLQPRVDVVLEQPYFVVLEIPHFVDTNESVAFVERFLEFGRTPRPGELLLFRSVVADPRFVEERFGDVVFGTRSAQGEHELVTATVRQNRMK